MRDSLGRFVKGNKINLGRKHSLETRTKLRNKNLKNGYINKDGYKMLRVLGRHIFEHRYVWEQHHGRITKEIHIHHINGNRLDNRIQNLIAMTNSEHTHRHWQEGKQHSVH